MRAKPAIPFAGKFRLIDIPKTAFRAKYDNNPQSFWGRLWRWHANWCPGWKEYMNSLAEDERNELSKKYNLKKYLA